MVNMWSTGLDAAGVQLQHLLRIYRLNVFSEFRPSCAFWSAYLLLHGRQQDQQLCNLSFYSIYDTWEAFSRGYTPHIRDDITKHVLFSLQNLPVFSPCVSSLCVSAAALPVLMSLFRFIKGLSEFSCCPWNRRRDRRFPISGKVGCFRFHN